MSLWFVFNPTPPTTFQIVISFHKRKELWLDVVTGRHFHLGFIRWWKCQHDSSSSQSLWMNFYLVTVSFLSVRRKKRSLTITTTKIFVNNVSCFKATLERLRDQTPAVLHSCLRGASENTIKRCFLLPETRTGRLILRTTWLLLSTAGPWLHAAWRHVSSLNFIYPSRAALLAKIYIPLFELSWALLRFVLRGRLASENERQKWRHQRSSRIFQQFVKGCFCIQLRFVRPDRCCEFDGSGGIQQGRQRTQARWTTLSSEGVIS